MKIFLDKNPILTSLKTAWQNSNVEIKTGVLFINNKPTWIDSIIIKAFYLANGEFIMPIKEFNL